MKLWEKCWAGKSKKRGDVRQENEFEGKCSVLFEVTACNTRISNDSLVMSIETNSEVGIWSWLVPLGRGYLT